MFSKFQTIQHIPSRIRDIGRMPPPMSRTRRLHKLIPMVRRRLPLSLGIRRIPNPLLVPPPAARTILGRLVRLRPVLGHIPRPVPPEDEEETSLLGVSTPPRKPLLRHGRLRRQGGDLLTQRGFYSICGNRPRDDRVTKLPFVAICRSELGPTPSCGVVELPLFRSGLRCCWCVLSLWSLDLSM